MGGTCKPCFFMVTKKNCTNGKSCNFCHMPHDPVDRVRPCKGKRARAKRQAKKVAEACSSVEELKNVAQSLDKTGEHYLKSVLLSRTQNLLRARETSTCSGTEAT